MNHKINDEYNEIESRQRRWQLRHPQKDAENKKAWNQSEAGKASQKLRNQRWAEKKRLEQDEGKLNA